MASRTLFRRLLQVNRRLHLQRVAIVRPLVAVSNIQQKYSTSQNSCSELRGTSQQSYSQLRGTSQQSYSQLRTLCTKAGEGMIINIQDDEDFEKRVLNNPLPVVVDFHATWCGPCKLLGPRLESLVGGKKGKVVLARIDIDDLQELAMKYMISSVPTVIGFKNKKKTDQFIGLQDDDIIDTFLDRLIG